MKFVITGMPSASGEAPQVLVKVNEKAATALELDSLVRLRDCEVRPSWRNTAGVVPESLVVGGLCGREMAVSLPAPKRRRDGIESFGVQRVA